VVVEARGVEEDVVFLHECVLAIGDNGDDDGYHIGVSSTSMSACKSSVTLFAAASFWLMSRRPESCAETWTRYGVAILSADGVEAGTSRCTAVLV
jgi:hypothetical protein